MKKISDFLEESVWYGKPMKDVVDDKKWQKLRTGLVGKWAKEYLKCCRELKSYVGNMKDIRKVRQVQNYLTGTYFRTHKNPQCAIDLRKKLTAARKKYKQVHLENLQ